MNAYFSREALSCDRVCELSCNLDDMTPEDIGFAMERLLEAGALDVYTVPIGMKKNRPATMLRCLCRAGEEEDFVQLLLRHTTTLGVRLQILERRVLNRQTVNRNTPWGPVRCKIAAGKEKPEYEDLAAIARQYDLPLSEVRRHIKQKETET